MFDLRLMAIFLIGGALLGHSLAPLNFEEITTVNAALGQLVPYAGFHILGGTIAYILFTAFCIQRRAREKHKSPVA